MENFSLLARQNVKQSLGDGGTDQEYWAAMPSDKAAPEVMERISVFYKDILASGRGKLWQRSYNSYYGLDENGTYQKSSAVSYGGEQGEMSLIKINGYRNLIQHILIMATAERPAFHARCGIYDAEAISQRSLAESIAEYAMREKRIEKKLAMALESSLIFDEGYLAAFWDANAGEVVGFKTDDAGQPIMNEFGAPDPIYSGDIDIRWYTPNAMPKDIYSEGDESTWYAPRDWTNRHDLIAKYPELRNNIMGVPTRDAFEAGSPLQAAHVSKSDLIPVYTFMHKKSPALPAGRLMILSDARTVYYDGPLPYEEVYVKRLAPSEMINTSHGYSSAYDLLSISQAKDAIMATWLTNIDAHGVQNIIAPDNCSLEAQDIGGGKKWVKYNEGAGAKPEVLDLLKLPGETFKVYEMLATEEQNVSGINSAARGTPEYSNMSGSALALLADKAVGFNRGTERSYFDGSEWCGNTTVRLYKQFASAPQIARIAGGDNSFSIREFTKKDLSSVNAIVIETTNALSKTTAGRMQIAEGIAKNFPGAITPAQYIEVLETGKLEPITNAIITQEARIKRENEGFYAGKKSEVRDLDKHSKHIVEHNVELDNPVVEANPALKQLITAHIAEHRLKLQTVDPYLLKMIGEEPIPPPQPPMAPGPAPAPSGGPAPKPPGQGTPPAMKSNVSPNGTPGMPKLPQ